MTALLGSVDYVTAVVVLVVAIAVTFASAAVVWSYARKRRIAPSGSGMMLWHIVVVASSVAGTWLTLALGQLDILGIVATPRAARLLGYAVFGSGTVASLILMGLVLRRRDRDLPAAEAPDPAGR